MILYAELFDGKSGCWNAVKLIARRDARKETGRTLILDVQTQGDADGPALRFTSDQAAKLLVGIAEALE